MSNKSRPRRMMRLSKPKRMARYFILFLVALGLCVRPLGIGILFYKIYWGDTVFVPFALVIAAGVIVIAILDMSGKFRDKQ